MSCFTDFHRELAMRTIKNYNHIKALSEKQITIDDNNAYEVTQLINSLLGIVVSIKESELFDEELSRIQFNSDWGCPTISNKYKGKDTIEIIKHLRNATAHMNIVPHPSKKETEISTITFKSINSETETTVWSCVFTVEELEKFLIKLSEYIQTH